MTELNRELLEKVMTQITDHPEDWDQMAYWRGCGTPSCVAGWAEHFSGLTAYKAQERYGTHHSAGATLLGISYREAYVFFDDHNTLPMLQLMAKDLLNGETLLKGAPPKVPVIAESLHYYQDLAEEAEK